MVELLEKRCICKLDKFEKGSEYGFLREKPNFGTIKRVDYKFGPNGGEFLLNIKLDSGETKTMSSYWVTILPYLIVEKIWSTKGR